MPTGYKYKDKDIAELTAKSSGESLENIKYIDPKKSKFTYTADVDSGTYSFIPYSDNILGKLWAAKKVAYNENYTSTDEEDSNKIANAAAWGSAPIPIRLGLNNVDSPYIDSSFHSLDDIEDYDYTLEWATVEDRTGIYFYKSTDSPTADNFITEASCVIADIVAKGGNGGNGYKGNSESECSGGGGGGSGAAASILIDMEKAEKIIFSAYIYPISTVLNICKPNMTFLSLGCGENGGDGTAEKGGDSGAGGGVSEPSATRGVSLLWSSSGASGGKGSFKGSNNDIGGFAGSVSPETIKFISDNTVSVFSGGVGGTGCENDDGDCYCWGGGGGGASIFNDGGDGGSIDTTGLEVTTINGAAGSGGGGGYIYKYDSAGTVSNRAGAGGNAAVRFYFERPGEGGYDVALTTASIKALKSSLVCDTYISTTKPTNTDDYDYRASDADWLFSKDSNNALTQPIILKTLPALSKLYIWGYGYKLDGYNNIVAVNSDYTKATEITLTKNLNIALVNTYYKNDNENIIT